MSVNYGSRFIQDKPQKFDPSVTMVSKDLLQSRNFNILRILEMYCILIWSIINIYLLWRMQFLFTLATMSKMQYQNQKAEIKDIKRLFRNLVTLVSIGTQRKLMISIHSVNKNVIEGYSLDVLSKPTWILSSCIHIYTCIKSTGPKTRVIFFF